MIIDQNTPFVGRIEGDKISFNQGFIIDVFNNRYRGDNYGFKYGSRMHRPFNMNDEFPYKPSYRYRLQYLSDGSGVHSCKIVIPDVEGYEPDEGSSYRYIDIFIFGKQVHYDNVFLFEFIKSSCLNIKCVDFRSSDGINGEMFFETEMGFGFGLDGIGVEIPQYDFSFTTDISQTLENPDEEEILVVATADQRISWEASDRDYISEESISALKTIKFNIASDEAKEEIEGLEDVSLNPPWSSKKLSFGSLTNVQVRHIVGRDAIDQFYQDIRDYSIDIVAGSTSSMVMYLEIGYVNKRGQVFNLASGGNKRFIPANTVASGDGYGDYVDSFNVDRPYSWY